MHDQPVTLPVFGFVCLHRRPLVDGVGREAEWARDCAATGRASAHLWQGIEGFVVPRRYTTLPGWARRPRGLELRVRASGGGLVPQGPGVWNLSLLWPAPSGTPVDTTGVYRALCTELSAALQRLGIEGATPQAVEGSWCDGRFNLAVDGAKLVGTAQAWKRVAAIAARDATGPAGDAAADAAASAGANSVPIVLAHAVIVVTADPAALTERANACEAALGNATRYRAGALTSIARCVGGKSVDVEARTLTVLAEQFARVVPPRASPPMRQSPRG